MRAVIQRVLNASVSVDREVVSQIDKGLLVLLGVDTADTQEDLMWLVHKIAGLRIFSDSEEKMNLSIQDVEGEVLVVSQFTLFGGTKKRKSPFFYSCSETR